MTIPGHGSGTSRSAYARTDALHPPHDPVPLCPVPARPVAEWPAGTFIENLAPAPGDTSGWLVTIPSHNRVDHVHPNGGHEVLAELTNPTGIVSDGTSALVVTGPMGTQGWRLVRLGKPGARVSAETVCDLPDLIFGNGMTWAGDHLLIADSLHGYVLAADPASGTSSVWLAHQLLTKSHADSPLAGVNGIATRNGWVYLTSSERALLLRCPLNSNQPATDLEVVAERLFADDLDLGPDGRIYLATHTYNSVLRLDQDGHREDIAGHAQGIAGSTSVAFDPHDPATLYVTTTGGILSPPGGKPEPARLIRLKL
jgi:hypothetical protein